MELSNERPGGRVSGLKAHGGRARLQSLPGPVYADLFSAPGQVAPVQVGSGGEPTASVTAPPEQVSFLGLSPSAPSLHLSWPGPLTLGRLPSAFSLLAIQSLLCIKLYPGRGCKDKELMAQQISF